MRKKERGNPGTGGYFGVLYRQGQIPNYIVTPFSIGNSEVKESEDLVAGHAGVICVVEAYAVAAVVLYGNIRKGVKRADASWSS